MIPTPSGKNEVDGVCKKCGEVRVHELTIPYAVFNSWRGNPKKANEAKAKKNKDVMSAGAAIKRKKQQRRAWKQKKGKNV